MHSGNAPRRRCSACLACSRQRSAVDALSRQKGSGVCLLSGRPGPVRHAGPVRWRPPLLARRREPDRPAAPPPASCIRESRIRARSGVVRGPSPRPESGSTVGPSRGRPSVPDIGMRVRVSSAGEAAERAGDRSRVVVGAVRGGPAVVGRSAVPTAVRPMPVRVGRGSRAFASGAPRGPREARRLLSRRLRTARALAGTPLAIDKFY